MHAGMEFEVEEFASPIGPLMLVSGGGLVRALEFEGYQERLERLLAAHWGGPVRLGPQPRASDFRRHVEDYFLGDLHAVDSIPVETGGTEFQRIVWRALRSIPPGHTSSYGALAARIGRPKAVRAVGVANSRNPVAIIVPCHRVVGANGSLTGYAAGLERKEWLLQHEGARLL